MEIFSIFFNMKVCCVFSLESLHQGDSNEYTQYTIFSIKRKITLNYPKICSYGIIFQGTQERVQNSCGKRTISVQPTEVLMYVDVGKSTSIKCRRYKYWLEYLLCEDVKHLIAYCCSGFC